MIVFQRVDSFKDTLSRLNEFAVCFPDLVNRVEDIEVYARKLFKYGNVYTLNTEDKIIGFVAFYSNDAVNRIGYISLIGILPEYRHFGYGTKLLDETIKSMKSASMKEVRLEVDSDNQIALKYYQTNGFTLLGKARDTSYYMRYVIK